MDRARVSSRRDAWIALWALLALVLWETSGLDLRLTRWIATPTGFPWRDSFLASRVLHDGGRALAWTMMGLLVWDWVRPFAAGPSQAQRARGIVVVLAGLLLVPLLKRFSTTSCPWDLLEFGGRAPYIPHWLIAMPDGGPGRCFPSGHAVAAFAFFGVYFLWRHHRPGAARIALLSVLVLGIVFGWAQWVRGAHFVSHTLWSAWLCWATAALGSRVWLTAPGDTRADFVTPKALAQP